ncbi:hypothetical protein NHX12_011972 [Muraenolepis orangiensis]|uniref:Uncharacterized protein n=1 Tax=Muraenolepis orangiensis TaxID=630683 RepID=A0A9Q0DG55_9TELE|nr:hypothetical protein NHX12_011972 [Muraenolepis orangiensis]
MASTQEPVGGTSAVRQPDRRAKEEEHILVKHKNTQVRLLSESDEGNGERELDETHGSVQPQDRGWQLGLHRTRRVCLYSPLSTTENNGLEMSGSV